MRTGLRKRPPQNVAGMYLPKNPWRIINERLPPIERSHAFRPISFTKTRLASFPVLDAKQYSR